MATALESQSSKLEIGNGDSPLTYTQIGGLVSFSAFDGQASEIDITDLDSVAKEFIMGLQDFGSFTGETNYLPSDAGQTAMRAAKAARTIQDFKFTDSASNTATFQGYVLSNPFTGSVDAKIDGSFAIRITGDVTFA